MVWPREEGRILEGDRGKGLRAEFGRLGRFMYELMLE